MKRARKLVAAALSASLFLSPGAAWAQRVREALPPASAPATGIAVFPVLAVPPSLGSLVAPPNPGAAPILLPLASLRPIGLLWRQPGKRAVRASPSVKLSALDKLERRLSDPQASSVQTAEVLERVYAGAANLEDETPYANRPPPDAERRGTEEYAAGAETKTTTPSSFSAPPAPSAVNSPSAVRLTSLGRAPSFAALLAAGAVAKAAWPAFALAQAAAGAAPQTYETAASLAPFAPALVAVYPIARGLVDRRAAPSSGPRTTPSDAAAAAAVGALVSWPFFFIRLLDGTVALLPAAAGYAFLHSLLIVALLGDRRSTPLYEWQASHDQAFRHDYPGGLGAWGGHPYGGDRFGQRAPGRVSAGEKAAARIFAAWLGLLFLSDPVIALAYAAALTAMFMLQDVLASPSGEAGK